jgi:hypothetical protein
MERFGFYELNAKFTILISAATLTHLKSGINFSIIYNNLYIKYNFYSFKTNSKAIEI